MAIIKKYNAEESRWEILAGDSASVIYSSNSSLLEDTDKPAISVEDALVRDREDIEKMKKNISWLALHGGNGSGGGGGTYVDVTNSIDILDANNNPTNNIIWKDTSKSVGYQITSSKASNVFSVTATLDGFTIYQETGVTQGQIRSISIRKINAYSTNVKHTLRISVIDKWDNVVTAQTSITETILKLNKSADIYTVNIDEATSGAALTLNYQTSIIGDYVLYWSTFSDLDTNPEHRIGRRELRITSSFAEDVTIPYWSSDQENRLLTTSDVRSGQNLTFYFVLISVSDNSVKSNVLEITSTVVSPTEIAIQPISLSTEIREATRVSKASIMNCNFIVYLNSVNIQYNYNITANKLEFNENTEQWDILDSKSIINGNTGRYGNITVVTYPALPRDDFFEGGYIYRFDIYAQDRMDISKYNTASCYIDLQSASDNIIPLNLDYRKIFEFNVWGDSGLDEQNWIWNNTNDVFNHSGEIKTVNTTMTLKHMGGKSALNITNCRLTNKAYAVINKSTVNEEPVAWFPENAVSSLSGLVPSSAPQFTLSLSYYNDFTPDDDRTIFNFGNFKPATSTTSASGNGILINNHDYYIQLGTGSPLITGKIQDSIYHELDIVVGRGNVTADSTIMVEVYHNGVLLAVNRNVPASDLFWLNRFNEMSIACYKQGDNLSQFTNLKLQSITLYAIALNPFEVVCNWINHLVTYQLDNNSLNTTLLNEKLRSNLITANNDGTYSCAIWDIQGNDYATQDWIVTNNGLAPVGSLHTICPIPIVILDLSTNTNWRWERFRQSWANTTQPSAENVPMYFYNPYGGSTVLNNTLVTVSGQGTTSKGYAIKNLEIDFGENQLFWAKQDWFPERYFTLKADVVDSAHVNNACVGKFVNTCAQNTDLLQNTPPMEYFNKNKNNSEIFNLPRVALGEGGVNIKHTLEGFPVLLLVKFLKSDGNTTNQSLGIYSFNLGRNAYYNMGFKMLKQFRDVETGDVLSENAIAPLLLGAPIESEDIIDFNAQSWEGMDSFNCSLKTANTEIEINNATNNGYNTSVNAVMPVQLDGYFWSSYPDHIRHFWENKYPGGADIADFRQLCTYLVSCPYSKGTFEIGMGGTVYQYDWSNALGKYIVPDQTSNAAAIQRLNMKLPINVTNAKFYYVISMLYGLVDSLGKNLNMRIWKDPHLENVDPTWFTCFYDMDTALGLDNVGTEKVRPDVLDEELYNDPELVRKFAYGTYGNEKMYTVRDNKLWGILDNSEFKDQYVGNANEGRYSIYASTWNVIRTNYLKSVDDFMSNYFDNQTDGVGELLYNQDFDVKYVNTPQSNFMYGDRKAFVRDWMRKRIAFLDSYFGYLQKSSSEPYLENTTIEDCSYNNIVKIKHNSGVEYIPIKTNAPCVITTTIGGQTSNSYYLPANTFVNVRVANSVGTPGIQTQINNSDLLLEISNLADLRVQGFEPLETKSIDTGEEFVDELYSKQYGSLSSFTKFDANGNTTFENKGIDFIKLFKTWNEGENTLPYTLTELNLSNTKNGSTTDFPLLLKSSAVGVNGAKYYQNPFENLTDIDISNSCVSSIVLPDGIALNTLKIAGSAIQNVNLKGQSMLKTIDFSNCVALTSVSLNDCSAFENLTLRNSPLLEEVIITKCPAIEEVIIDMEDNENAITIQIDQVPNLKKISILNVSNQNSIVSIIATGLEELNLQGCKFSSIILSEECKTSLQYLDISNSSINILDWNGTFQGDYLDLYDCPNLVTGGINIINNKAIDKIQLPNNEYNPVNINFEFTGCTNLTRIYGNIIINKTAVFNNCAYFKLHDGKFGVDKDHLNNTVVNGKQLYLADNTIVNEALADIFQAGREVTNLTIDIANASNMFSNTAIDNFDVYYVLRHLSSNVRNISSMFSDCNLSFELVNNGGTFIDNSPHWTMFDKCGQITNISSLFYNSFKGKYFRIYGNHTDEGGHQGLFTPLVNCVNFDSIFDVNTNIYSSAKFITDRKVFKLNSGTYGGQATVSFNRFFPHSIFNNVNIFTASGVNAKFNTIQSADGNGNLHGLFDSFYRLPSSISYTLTGLSYINYSPETFDPLPIEVTSLYSCFSASNSIGNPTLQQLFTRNSNNKFDVVSLEGCFGGSAGSTWYLTNDSLEGFNKLTTFTSVFNGMQHAIAYDFPYDIFDPCCTTIKNVSGFFSGAIDEGYTNTPDIPGDLFKKCINLENASYCFSRIRIPFNPSPNGFINCPKLVNVSYMFEGTTQAQSCIPANFFNLGFVDSTKTIIGAGINTLSIQLPINAETPTLSSNGEYTVVVREENMVTSTRYKNVVIESGTIICNPTSTYSQRIDVRNNGIWNYGTYSNYMPLKEYNDWDPQEPITINIHIPRKKISNITGLFNHALFPVYEHTINWSDYTDGGDVEPNPEYCPYDYIYDGNKWVSVTRDNKPLTFMWAFDGLWSSDILSANLSNYLLDDEPILNGEVINYGNSAVQNYGCPPDLLRWCTNNSAISGLFSDGNFAGRIPAYLLKPVPNVSSTASMFYDCTNIVAYKTASSNGDYITIPETFFSYATNVTNLTSMFRYCVFYSNIPNVFDKLTKSLNVSYIFYGCTWINTVSDGKLALSGIFGSNKVSNCSYAFAEGHGKISFTQMFNTDKAKHPLSADDHVFYGYEQSNVTHEVSKTCDTNPKKKNYAYAGQ